MRPLRLVLLLVFALGVPLVAGPAPLTAAQDATPTDCPPTTEEENEAIARRWHEEAVSQHDPAVFDEILAADVPHDSATLPDNPGPHAVLEVLLTGFPDVRHTVDAVVAEDDLVAVGWTAMGTHEGEFQGIAPTGKAVTWTGINLFRIECARIAEIWTEVDAIGRLQQLGVLPASEMAMGDDASPVAGAEADCPTTGEDENKTLAQRWFDEVWTQGNLDVLDELLAADHRHHWAAGPDSTGVDVVKERIDTWRAAFPDLRGPADRLIADGDLVAARWTATGTHQGEYQGMAPTGAAVEWTGINIFRIECGRIAEVWSEMDTLGLRQQLGMTEAATPAP